MALSNLGNCAFADLFDPIKGKNEWGIDTLTRKLSGARSLLSSFVAGLAQGQSFQGYFLQTWEANEDPAVAQIQLNYKGLFSGGTPRPDIKSEIQPSAGTKSADYSAENSGKGRQYMVRTFQSFNTGTIVGYDSVDVPVYCVGATIEFTYDAVQSEFRYISVGKPNGPRFFYVDIPRIPRIKRARVITSDGARFGRAFPATLSDLEPEVLDRIVHHESHNVIGSPLYECVDVCRRELGEGEEDNQGSFGG